TSPLFPYTTLFRSPTTALHPPRIPNRRCWPRSTGFTASRGAPKRSETISPTLVSSLIETDCPTEAGRGQTMTNRIRLEPHRTLRLLSALTALSIALGACTYTNGEVVTASVPDDHRQRHPIAIEEAKRSVGSFVGEGRGGLSPSQRADVLGLAQIWVREGTGAIVADVPVDTPNARAAASSFQEIRALLAAGGVPPRGITLNHYHPDDPRTLA